MIRFGLFKNLFFNSITKPVAKATIRRLATNPALSQSKQKNSFCSEKKNLKHKKKNSSRFENNYCKLQCKCEKQTKFKNFDEFLDHLKNEHDIKKVNITEIIKEFEGKKREVKFYWGLSCQCGNRFSSSLCNSDLRIEKGKITTSKIYKLYCLKCKEVAKFEREDLLQKFLQDRVKQKLVYSFFREKFEKYDKEPGKKLEDHIEELCEKCQILGKYCGNERISEDEKNVAKIVSTANYWKNYFLASRR